MLPVWDLIPPTVLHGVTHYIVFTIGKGLATVVIKRVTREKQTAQVLKKDGLRTF